ncbi:CLUMA_CG004352, isoform A [Clunio marinus]|uniref:CLUMA_CG004352, isoform A n=1 Tax=Clunio marinus TaxID=568069 RepID=A0A1J1HRP5_9DIPT|nr:CLUMA_CG004352, isoform A [Clunio marinus]
MHQALKIMSTLDTLNIRNLWNSDNGWIQLEIQLSVVTHPFIHDFVIALMGNKQKTDFNFRSRSEKFKRDERVWEINQISINSYLSFRIEPKKYKSACGNGNEYHNNNP